MLRYWLIMPQPPQRQQARRVDVGATCGGGGAVRGLVAILLGLSIWSKMANSQASAVVFGAFMRAGIWGFCGRLASLLRAEIRRAGWEVRL